MELQNERDFQRLKKLIFFSKKHNCPVACLVKKNIFFSVIKRKKLKKRGGLS